MAQYILITCLVVIVLIVALMAVNAYIARAEALLQKSLIEDRREHKIDQNASNVHSKNGCVNSTRGCVSIDCPKKLHTTGVC